jgi:hypothetical protein
MARKSSAKKSSRTTRRAASRKHVRNSNGNGNGKVERLDAQTIRTLISLGENVDRYGPILRKKLRAAGVKPTPATIFSAAMYYETLDRLAKE